VIHQPIIHTQADDERALNHLSNAMDVQGENTSAAAMSVPVAKAAMRSLVAPDTRKMKPNGVYEHPLDWDAKFYVQSALGNIRAAYRLNDVTAVVVISPSREVYTVEFDASALISDANAPSNQTFDLVGMRAFIGHDAEHRSLEMAQEFTRIIGEAVPWLRKAVS
jgi:hypothetical protein